LPAFFFDAFKVTLRGLPMSADESAASSDQFQVRTTSDSHFSWIRTRLSVERTQMAWIRTSVSLIGFGFTIVQFFQRLNDTAGVIAARRPQAPRYLGLALIGAGILTLCISALQYRRVVLYLWSEPFTVLTGKSSQKNMEPVIAQSPVLAVALVVLFIGIFAFGAVLLRMV
jgi:putative membrane protein